MKAFLSSTYIDLIEHRQLAIEALQRLGQEVGRMEVFGARPEEPTKACLSEIEACDVFIGVYAHRYGYVPSDSHISITEAEYNYAVELKKPMFCFMVKEEYPWPPRMIEEHPTKSKLLSFKQRVSEAFVRDDFTTPEVLAFKIASSIGRYLTQTLRSKSVSFKNSQDPEHKSIERILKLRVHQAQFVNGPGVYYFINATNLSPKRELEVTHVWYEDQEHHIPVIQPARPLPVRLVADQSWETWISLDQIPEAYRFSAFESFRARISAGTIFKSEANLDVPPYGFVPGGSISSF